MEYKIKKCLSVKGKTFYQLYVVVDGKDYFVTSFNANRFNRGAIMQITANNTFVGEKVPKYVADECPF